MSASRKGYGARSPERHPAQRASDQGRWARARCMMVRENWYRDIWLLVITGFVAYALILSTHRQSELKETQGDLAAAQKTIAGQQSAITKNQAAIQRNRIEQTRTNCLKQGEIARGTNRLGTVLQTLLLAGAALPGDTPGPLKVTKPSDWRTLKPGPLSRQLEATLPGFPTAQQRLDLARANAKQIADVAVKPRNCKREVERVRRSGQPKHKGKATPTPSP